MHPPGAGLPTSDQAEGSNLALADADNLLTVPSPGGLSNVVVGSVGRG